MPLMSTEGPVMPDTEENEAWYDAEIAPALKAPFGKGTGGTPQISRSFLPNLQ